MHPGISASSADVYAIQVHRGGVEWSFPIPSYEASYVDEIENIGEFVDAYSSKSGRYGRSENTKLCLSSSSRAAANELRMMSVRPRAVALTTSPVAYPIQDRSVMLLWRGGTTFVRTVLLSPLCISLVWFFKGYLPSMPYDEVRRRAWGKVDRRGRKTRESFCKNQARCASQDIVSCSQLEHQFRLLSAVCRCRREMGTDTKRNASSGIVFINYGAFAKRSRDASRRSFC